MANAHIRLHSTSLQRVPVFGVPASECKPQLKSIPTKNIETWKKKPSWKYLGISAPEGVKFLTNNDLAIDIYIFQLCFWRWWFNFPIHIIALLLPDGKSALVAPLCTIRLSVWRRLRGCSVTSVTSIILLQSVYPCERGFEKVALHKLQVLPRYSVTGVTRVTVLQVLQRRTWMRRSVL